jgi:hypothetical protein
MNRSVPCQCRSHALRGFHSLSAENNDSVGENNDSVGGEEQGQVSTDHANSDTQRKLFETLLEQVVLDETPFILRTGRPDNGVLVEVLDHDSGGRQKHVILAQFADSALDYAKNRIVLTFYIRHLVSVLAMK